MQEITNAAPPTLRTQETAEHNAELMKQVLPPHVLSSLNGGSRILVEKIPCACLLQVCSCTPFMCCESFAA